MRDFTIVKYASLAVMFTCLLDFGVNTIYTPYVTSSSFLSIILWMLQIVTILLQFFSWFFLMNLMNEVRYGGYSSALKRFWPLFITGCAYLLFFLLNIIIQLIYMSRDNDIYSLWNNGIVMTFWSLQRLVSIVHYAFSMFYTLKLLSNSALFL